MQGGNEKCWKEALCNELWGVGIDLLRMLEGRVGDVEFKIGFIITQGQIDSFLLGLGRD